MALNRGERGQRGDHFFRGERDRREYRDYGSDDHDRYTRGEYDEYGDDARYEWQPERRYDTGDSLSRGRDDQRVYENDDERGRFLDIRRRYGFLRGENAGRYGRDDYRSAGAARRPDDFGQEARWSGPYAGRGPKGYRRSDERIYEEVCERLMEHPSIDASDIEVSVAEGDVTLAGLVESRAIKHLAEAMTETVSGVKEVHNQLRVAPRDSVSGPPRFR